MTPQVTCVGETMLLLTAVERAPLDRASLLSMGVAGAESNVACALAALGHRAAWLSSVGDDPFGRVIVRSLRERGVGVSGVRLDPARPAAPVAGSTAPSVCAGHDYR